jgi:hypothetical protein
MNEIDGQESETTRIRGTESEQNLRIDANSSSNAKRTSEGAGNQLITLNRESSKEGISPKSAIGGILDQLLEDAEKQLVKSRECIVWYREEAKEYEQKIENLRKLKKLEEQEPEKNEISLKE